MSGQSGGDTALEWIAEKVHIPNDVQDLVPGEFVGESEVRVEDVVLADEDEIVESSPRSQSQFVDHLHVPHEAEGPGRSDFIHEDLEIPHCELDILLSDRRRVIEKIRDGQPVMGLESQALFAVADRIEAIDDDLSAGTVLIDDSDFQQAATKFQRRS